jgi:hypothetical protein
VSFYSSLPDCPFWQSLLFSIYRTCKWHNILCGYSSSQSAVRQVKLEGFILVMTVAKSYLSLAPSPLGFSLFPSPFGFSLHIVVVLECDEMCVFVTATSNI